VPEGNFEITSINDISQGGNRVLPNITPAVGVKSSDSTPVTMDYTPYADAYPYDINQPSVTYENFYEQTVWTTGSTPLFYSCTNSDDTPNSHHDCTHTVTSTSTSHSTSNPPLKYSGDYWYCTAGTLGGNITSGYYCVVTTTTTTTVNDGPAIRWYAWSEGATTEKTITSSPVDGTVMPAVCPRTFSLNNASEPANSVSVNSTENPTSITVSGNVQATFGVEPDTTNRTTFRQATQVNGIDTVIQVEVYHQNSDLSISGPQGYYYNESSTNLKSSYASSSLNYESSQDYSIPWSMSVAMPPLQYGDEICINLTTNPSAGEVSSPTWTPQNITQYLSNQQNADDPWPTSTQSVCTQYLAAAPYLKVFGGDVSAGTASDINNLHQCTADYGIDTYNQDTAPYAGSGTQLAAFAANAITGFASAQNDNGSGTSPPIGLTFSNTSGGYGGNFGASPSDCSTDYYHQGVTPSSSMLYTNTDVGTALADIIAGNPNGGIFAYQVDGGTINTTNIPVGYNITLYSSEPITIAGNITYSDGFTTLSQIPKLELVTYGEPININHNVTQLTGIYVAEGSGGIINDCADVSSTNYWYQATDGSPDCSQQLIVEGSFTANALYLSRTYGSVHEATTTPAEVPCAFGASPCNNAAEEFDYSPADWLAYPNQNTTPVVQAIFSLPPVL
jgi:hypothetical protein